MVSHKKLKICLKSTYEKIIQYNNNELKSKKVKILIIG